MLKDRTLLCMSYAICPIIYVNKLPPHLNYRRARAKGSNPFVNRDRLSVFETKIFKIRKRSVFTMSLLPLFKEGIASLLEKKTL